jgi:hypothetical protein
MTSPLFPLRSASCRIPTICSSVNRDYRIPVLLAAPRRRGLSTYDRTSKLGYPPVGTPQGAGISPLLAYIVLHYALDLWVQRWRRRVAHGKVSIVRHADDFVMGFQTRRDAEQMHVDLVGRLEKFGLHFHGEKTRVI